jgi:hypothetical protein
MQYTEKMQFIAQLIFFKLRISDSNYVASVDWMIVTIGLERIWKDYKLTISVLPVETGGGGAVRGVPQSRVSKTA